MQSSFFSGSGDPTVVGRPPNRAIEWRISHPAVGSRVVVIQRDGHGMVVRRDVGRPPQYKPFDVTPDWFDCVLDVVREAEIWPWRHTTGRSNVAAMLVLELPPHVRCTLLIPERDFGAPGPRHLIEALESATAERVVIASPSDVHTTRARDVTTSA